jgi:hypothetical protein
MDSAYYLIWAISDESYVLIKYGSFLLLDIIKVWKVKHFDIIIGNPPYQESDENSKSIGGTNLYTKFINKSFELLDTNGYLVFITPISWMGPSTNVQMGSNILHNIFLKYDVYYLNLNECKKYFNVGSTFSYYIIKKSITPNLITNIVSEYKKKVVNSIINIKKYKNLKFLPIHITNETLDLVHEIISKKHNLIIDRCRKLDTSNKSGKTHLKLKQDNQFKYITYHTTSKTFYADIKLDIYDDIKILLNMAGYLKPEICKNCNITESKFYIKIKTENEAKKIINLLESEKIKQYLDLCKYSGFNSRPVIESITYNTFDDNEDIKSASDSSDELDSSEDGSFSDLEDGSFSDLEDGSFSDLEDDTYLNSKLKQVNKNYLYYSLRYLFEDIDTKGSVIPQIQIDSVRKTIIKVPTPTTMKKYNLEKLFNDVDQIKERLETTKKEHEKEVNLLMKPFENKTQVKVQTKSEKIIDSDDDEDLDDYSDDESSEEEKVPLKKTIKGIPQKQSKN